MANVKQEEYDALVRQNAELRAELERTRGVDAAAVEQAGLRAAAANTPRTVKGPNGEIRIPDGVFLSEGLRADLERHGRAIDPNTGDRLGDWTEVDKAEASARNASTGPARGFAQE